MKNIVIFGSTGSIGRQALEVVDAHPSLFSVIGLSAHSNSNLILKQIERYKPKFVIVTSRQAYDVVSNASISSSVAIYPDMNLLDELLYGVDFVLGAISGAAGIESTLIALKNGINVGLANKETIVSAWDLVKKEKDAHKAEIIPVDSEHSAIFQCLNNKHEISKIILTASGGPFRTLDSKMFSEITVEKALAHPKWNMGKKISVDSATLMNKGLEVIEAQHLFNVDLASIDVVIHPESVIHSMIEYVDGSILAQLGEADMRLPIQYALTYPERVSNPFKRLSLTDYGTLTFGKPRREAFPALDLAYHAARLGGTIPAILNAANEVAVHAFLNRRIRYLDIIPLVHATLDTFQPEKVDTLEHLFEIDDRARKKVDSIIEQKGSGL